MAEDKQKLQALLEAVKNQGGEGLHQTIIRAALHRKDGSGLPAPENMAMRVILCAMVTLLAEAQKANGGKPAQAWVNDLAVICQELILEADINVDDSIGFNVDKFRAEAVANVSYILSDVRVSDAGIENSN